MCLVEPAGSPDQAEVALVDQIREGDALVLVYLDNIFFFFQAEDGIRDLTVTGVQTCALPISIASALLPWMVEPVNTAAAQTPPAQTPQAGGPGVPVTAATVDVADVPVFLNGKIGRASCRERV